MLSIQKTTKELVDQPTLAHMMMMTPGFGSRSTALDLYGELAIDNLSSHRGVDAGRHPRGHLVSRGAQWGPFISEQSHRCRTKFQDGPPSAFHGGDPRCDERWAASSTWCSNLRLQADFLLHPLQFPPAGKVSGSSAVSAVVSQRKQISCPHPL